MKFYEVKNSLFISTDVIAQYAGIATNECPGVVGMAMLSVKDGFYRVLKKDRLNKGVDIKINENNEIVLTLHIFTLYDVRIPEVAERITKQVSYILEEQLGIKNVAINICIEGVKFNS